MLYGDGQNAQAKEGTDNGDHNELVVQLVSHGKNGVVGYKAAEYPILAFIGHIAAVKGHGRTDGVDGLAAHSGPEHLAEPRILGALQGEVPAAPLYGVVEGPLAGDAAVIAVSQVYGNGVARVLVLIQVPNGEEVVVDVGGGNLRADDAVDGTVQHQGHRVGNHPVAVQGIIFQHEGHGPAAQQIHIYAPVGARQQIGGVEEVIRFPGSRSQEGEAGAPAVVQGDTVAPGQLLAAPLQ